MTLTIDSNNVYTQMGVAISVTGIAQVRHRRWWPCTKVRGRNVIASWMHIAVRYISISWKITTEFRGRGVVPGYLQMKGLYAKTDKRQFWNFGGTAHEYIRWEGLLDTVIYKAKKLKKYIFKCRAYKYYSGIFPLYFFVTIRYAMVKMNLSLFAFKSLIYLCTWIKIQSRLVNLTSSVLLHVWLGTELFTICWYSMIWQFVYPTLTPHSGHRTWPQIEFMIW